MIYDMLQPDYYTGLKSNLIYFDKSSFMDATLKTFTFLLHYDFNMSYLLEHTYLVITI